MKIMADEKRETANVRLFKTLEKVEANLHEEFGFSTKRQKEFDALYSLCREESNNDHFHAPGYTASANQSVFNEIWQERKRQNEKWGEQNHHPFIWLSILGEEVGECHEACLEVEFGGKPEQRPLEEWKQLRLEEWKQLRKELIQVAAVAEAIVESLDRNQLSD